MRSNALLRELVAQAKPEGGFPDEVRAKAATCLADFISCAIEAADLPWSRQALAVAVGGNGPCAVIGEAATVGALDAAFANSVRGHGLVREDMHAGSISHMGVVVWPVVLALVAENPDLVADPLEAAIAGYEIGGRVGRALITPDMARRFRPTGLIGPLSGALAGAILLGLDQDKTVNALALAANAFGGLNEWPHSGADDMYFHPGFAARNALSAVKLAALGAKGSDSALDGVAGLFPAFGIPLPTERISLYPNGTFEIMAVFNKEVPACNFAQSPCQVALAAINRVGDGDSVEKIHLSTYNAALNYPGCNYRGPFETPLQAKMSIFFGMAATIARGEIAQANYALLNDAAITDLIDRTTITVSDWLDGAFPARQGAELRLETKRGEVIVELLDDVRSASPELVRKRLADAAAIRLGKQQAQQIELAIENLTKSGASARAVAALEQLCRTGGGERAV
ncbi:MmgE/PrpD family protein [Agrobacterium sp. Azo12]|uniref:MmgE/PrpD family protein n=1 Tax=Agrobacterium sp. Azo12 TaxID=3031129 RepID=UPI0023D7C2CC|nr:MmgE/PrpD family protein [Agrobacterium sp. Azo12]MDO5897532.1 MmgE/PrpD family protein [Agrobacterium sp. Azo12]